MSEGTESLIAARRSLALDKLDAIREWVDSGIEQTLAEDPSGFMLGVESASVIQALDVIKEALDA